MCYYETSKYGCEASFYLNKGLYGSWRLCKKQT